MRETRGMTLRSALVGLLLTLCIVGAEGQVRSEQYFTNSLPDNSVVYALPRTLLYAHVTIDELQEEPGELALYARQYLGETNAILKPARRFVLRNVEIGSYGTPDEERRYSVRFRRNSSATYVTLASNGLLVGINTPSAEVEELPETNREVIREPLGSQLGSPLPPEYIQATTTAKRAEIAAEELYRIRDSKNRVISGESEQPFRDGEALRLAIGRLDQTEQQLTQYFLGQHTEVRETHLVTGLDPSVREQRVAFRFSEQEGLLHADDLRGEPIYLNIEVLEEAVPLSEKEQSQKERALRRGIIYVVPGRVMVTLTYRGDAIAKQEIPVAQLGALEVLDETLFTTKGVRTAILFHTDSGAIAKVQEVAAQD
ncbi:MAG: DUF4831 family protein [Porphyromonas sp.]|nr:DUF4831 family protein [Porphyromonas sp.]